MTDEYVRALAGDANGRVRLGATRLIYARLFGEGGRLVLVHDRADAVRAAGEVLLVAPTQAGHGLTGYRVVEHARPVSLVLYTNDAGTVIQINPATLAASSLGVPGISFESLATITGVVFIGGFRTSTNPIRFWQGGDWFTVTDIASSLLDFTRPQVVAANGVGYALVQAVGTNDLTLYRLAPPATTSTLVSSMSFPNSGEFLLEAVAAGIGSEAVFVSTQFTNAVTFSVNYALYKWDGTAWSALAQPFNAGLTHGALSVYGEYLYWNARTRTYRTGRTDGTAWELLTTSRPAPHFIDSAAAAANGSVYGAGYNQLAVSETGVPLGSVHYGAGGTTRRSYLRDLTAGTNLVTSDWSQEIHGTPMTGPQAVPVGAVDVVFFAMGDQGGTVGVPPAGVFRWDGAAVTTAYTTASGPPQLWKGVAVVS